MKKAQKRGYNYEKQQAKKHKGKHVGGSKNFDYKRGRTKGEVKHWTTQPVHKGIIKKAYRRGVKEISSISGFTEPAKKYAKEKGIKLIQRGKKKT